jgi:hypothetical protein
MVCVTVIASEIKKNRVRFMKRQDFISALLAALAASLACADELKPSQTLEYGGKVIN